MIGIVFHHQLTVPGPENTTLSKNLKSIVNNFRFKDILSARKSKPQYTYYHNEYGARLDRIYVSKFYTHIVNTSTNSAYFSDHLSVTVEINISTTVQIGRPQWRMNVSLLKDNLIKENFGIMWAYLQTKKGSFTNILSWWEDLVKPNIKRFFIQQGREKNRLQYGLINYLETELRKQYEISNETGTINYSEIRSIKSELDSYRQQLATGVKVRSRVQDTMANETISKFLIAKQKEIAQKKIIYSIEDGNGTTLSTFSEIQSHITGFFKDLYHKGNCDIEKQEFFLSFLHNELSDSDRELLGSPISIPDIQKAIKDMSLNKTPGNDGLPLEIYDENWEIIGNDLLTIYKSILETGHLSESQRQAVITLIPNIKLCCGLSPKKNISFDHMSSTYVRLGMKLCDKRSHQQNC